VIRLSKKSDYGIIALSYIAQSPGRVVSAKEVAQHCGGHNSVIANLLKEFAKAELLVSVRGLHGGYRLARPATSISLKEILDLLEGPMALVECAIPAGPSGSLCSLTGTCPSRRPMLVLHHRIARLLEETRLSDLSSTPMPAGTSLSLAEIDEAVSATHAGTHAGMQHEGLTSR
jgi:Rrf2 family protein